MKQITYEMMVRAYAADLFRFAYWMCRNRWQAEDLVQETFAAAWRARDALRDESAAKAWLFSILRNEHARIYQRKRVEIEDSEIDDLPATSFSGYERVELVDALNMLPEQFREPLLLQILGGFSGREIAGTLGISEQNVMTRLTRARQSLQRMATTHNAYRKTRRR
jgi:RNA polymerase sigma-70 factor (ECF subfamily)